MSLMFDIHGINSIKQCETATGLNPSDDIEHDRNCGRRCWTSVVKSVIWNTQMGLFENEVYSIMLAAQ